ncbi:TPA: DUF2165 family protein [Campylobacter jejuni]|nr:DUF2165 family protein [Campylobacter jejuni]HEF5589966.1 DUF2165 family protein [Campylobacter jejuni]HEF7428071.1 DUF2165 family protein [Campylobacter jejuni]
MQQKCFCISKMIRFSKIIILLTVVSLAGIVVFGNVTDYNSNFQFVSHVMSMDTKPDYLGNAVVYNGYYFSRDLSYRLYSNYSF